MAHLPILFRDRWLAVVDKPAGVAVHGGSGVAAGATLLALLREAGLDDYAPAHRLDRATSGCLLVARPEVAEPLRRAFAAHRVEKRYLALCQGQMEPPTGRIEAPLVRADPAAADAGRHKVAVDPAGRPAATRYRTVTAWRQASLVELVPESGRTHQLRVHLAHLGHPLAGDRRYGSPPFNRLMARRYGLTRLFLHATELRLTHPTTGVELAVQAPLAAELEALLAALPPPRRG
ncbi:MAG: hypothetical protein AUK30_11085 [Nitrospirae bacterium CG2_30_70_394]|nr:RluA family pseudouridine synthase [Deltaproteobacteria bacterium]OIP61876.1 MAG: hypothetical protein AUK30_11085 [Nitrospirae bacterium CG2_30_70_394]PIU79779.1 MAG: RNA pseudouridine synthase [Nitrospirae bacterium CG06_land_8_20_14_3_00_70_43]PIW83384.1 MAG: RNA pseudouridine synthase [Nitrospirae bacterium CG_4_8_14_3_um_filter_70_85]PIX82079.1 MAG: RNA pseudouridine synthase [Nitrospirae bacterium CG_4_10_14_3_um_filter_70_108]PJB96155.1 MAG: RNA pseudouridine synthase [Nitrospirae ba